jgi:hypothetical protein
VITTTIISMHVTAIIVTVTSTIITAVITTPITITTALISAPVYVIISAPVPGVIIMVPTTTTVWTASPGRG